MGEITKLIALGFILLLGSLFVLSSAAVAQDQLGTITASTVTCPTSGLTATACYALDISCPGLPDYTAYVKVIAPPKPVGTVILTSGGDVNDTYEDAYPYGTVTVQNIVNANFTAVELTYGLPFSNGPGWQWNAGGAGVRKASCRYATVVQWVYNGSNSIPLCATGSSAGGQLISEGLAHYGLGSYLAFAEITSGPPFGRVDHACINTVQQAVEYCSGADVRMGVGTKNAIDYIDPAYPGAYCSTSLQTGSTQYEQLFLNDSVTSPDAVVDYPNTKLRFLFGGLDTSSAIRQGVYYQSKIKSSTTRGCVKDAPHSIPIVLDGAEQIAADVVANCHR
jgi:hypothetical protein